jgi:hypothetical protein
MMSGPTEGTSLRELLRERRAGIQAAAARRGAFNLRVFGSLARDDDADSGIDVLVDFEASRSPIAGRRRRPAAGPRPRLEHAV